MIMVIPQPGKYAHFMFYIFIFTTIHWVSDGSECVAGLEDRSGKEETEIHIFWYKFQELTLYSSCLRQ